MQVECCSLFIFISFVKPLKSLLKYIYIYLMQEKAVGNVNKLRQCTGLKANLNQDLSSGSQFPSNHLNKVYTCDIFFQSLFM